MYEDTERFVDIDFEQKVRQTAYHLWEADGRPGGEETKYWFLALEQLLGDKGRKENGLAKTSDTTRSALH